MPQRYAKDNRTAHLTARSDKFVAYITNNKRLYSTRVVLLKLTTDRHEALRVFFAIAELLVLGVGLHIHQRTKFLFLPRLVSEI